MPEIPTAVRDRTLDALEVADLRLLPALRRALAAVFDRLLEGLAGTAEAAVTAAVSVDDFDGLETAWNAQVDREIHPIVAQLYEDSARDAFRVLAATDVLTFRVSDPAFAEFMATASRRIKGIGQRTWSELRDSLAEGIAHGESQVELQARVKEQILVSRARAETIARTEARAARNGGAMAGARALGEHAPAYKQWIATLDGRTRHSHAASDGQVVPLGERFNIGGASLDYPGDPDGPAEEVVNCRCRWIAVEEPDSPIVYNGRQMEVSPQAAAQKRGAYKEVLREAGRRGLVAADHPGQRHGKGGKYLPKAAGVPVEPKVQPAKSAGPAKAPGTREVLHGLPVRDIQVGDEVQHELYAGQMMKVTEVKKAGRYIEVHTEGSKVPWEWSPTKKVNVIRTHGEKPATAKTSKTAGNGPAEHKLTKTQREMASLVHEEAPGDPGFKLVGDKMIVHDRAKAHEAIQGRLDIAREALTYGDYLGSALEAHRERQAMEKLNELLRGPTTASGLTAADHSGQRHGRGGRYLPKAATISAEPPKAEPPKAATPTALTVKDVKLSPERNAARGFPVLAGETKIGWVDPVELSSPVYGQGKIAKGFVKANAYAARDASGRQISQHRKRSDALQAVVDAHNEGLTAADHPGQKHSKSTGQYSPGGAYGGTANPPDVATPSRARASEKGATKPGQPKRPKPMEEPVKPGKTHDGTDSHTGQSEQAGARRLARSKIRSVPTPSEAAVAKARKELVDAQAKRAEEIRTKGKASTRPGGSKGGGSKDIAAQRRNLFLEGGGAKKGYVPCHGCGLKLHHTRDAAENPHGFEVLERGKIFTKRQGGGYQLPNLLAECHECNHTRGNKPLRRENLT